MIAESLRTVVNRVAPTVLRLCRRPPGSTVPSILYPSYGRAVGANHASPPFFNTDRAQMRRLRVASDGRALRRLSRA